MSEATGQEKTEDPTARKLSKAREEGQVARSIELPAAVIVIGTLMLLMMTGGWLIARMATVFANGFVFDRATVNNPLLLPAHFGDQMLASFVTVMPIMVFTVIAAIVASGATGGYLFSMQAVAPKSSKLSLISGLNRIFGAHAAVELGKAILKFTLVSLVLWWSLMSNMDALIQMGQMSLEPALASAGGMVVQSALWVALSLAVIALIDVPYQKYSFNKRMRMTKQEVKDEYRQMEGSPEVKAQIRRRQREMANSRMMQRIKDADVVITNPEHFAVALEYDPTGDGAPVMVAKGLDHMATLIREEAKAHGVYLFEAPPLARAIYFTTDIEQQVPADLYHAVAQVIAYVFSLEAASPLNPPQAKPRVKVPNGMLFNPDGSRPEKAADQA
ncbi:MAG: flagellar biosynthesis protein FlhB [Limnohabitans sp.]|jgi:flagellar biosynthetic protein FlhB|uniref:flagellar biosynthesis protein FlhB n=1 Tax=Limnohabitans sp. TaxID=1907725 RepID=UPI0025E8ACE7|nr:flagellar biosynthesis protein FlhB [Limnohabitans sp.]MCO4088206.1 flagellar biosynthesis protein FlhB [Limnohabitans sp.]